LGGDGPDLISSSRHVTARRRLPGHGPPISEGTDAESPRERFAGADTGSEGLFNVKLVSGWSNLVLIYSGSGYEEGKELHKGISIACALAQLTLTENAPDRRPRHVPSNDYGTCGDHPWMEPEAGINQLTDIK
jgi:hypothetical protein